MITNTDEEMWLCNLAFQEYIIRQNILSYMAKENATTNEAERKNIELKIEELQEGANYLIDLRNKNKKSL